MKIIGLAGGSGSGKGTVAGMLLDFNIPSIDTDALYHGMTTKKSPCLDALVAEFGASVLSPDGSLNRAVLADIVFSSSDADKKRETLNKIAHHYVLIETQRALDEYRHKGVKAVLIDAPLLFESGFDKLCDFLVSVISERQKRIDRIIARDGISREKAEQRINAQMSDEQLISKSDFIIVNNGTREELYNKVVSLAEQIKNIGG